MSVGPGVPGLTVGHWTHPAGTTGCTVLRFEPSARMGHWVPGSAPGSREWGVLEPDHLAGAVHALVLSGGSAFGLATADGVMAALAEQGVGFDTGAGVVPIVPAAILFDLDQGPHRPDAAAGRAALREASAGPVATGPVGAGAGARVGRGLGAPLPGGLGHAAGPGAGHALAAVVAVNAVGAVVHPRTGAPLTHPDPPAPRTPGADWRGHTTLAAVVTDAPLDRAAARIVAMMASAALARCFRPAFTPFDGDVVFVAGLGQGPPLPPEGLVALGHAAAERLAEAILTAVSSPPSGHSPRES